MLARCPAALLSVRVIIPVIISHGSAMRGKTWTVNQKVITPLPGQVRSEQKIILALCKEVKGRLNQEEVQQGGAVFWC